MSVTVAMISIFIGFGLTSMLWYQIGAFAIGFAALGCQVVYGSIIVLSFENKLQSHCSYRFMYGLGMLLASIFIILSEWSKHLEEENI